MAINRIEEFQRSVKDFDSLIIVEGKKDREALSKIGFSDIIDISGKSLEKIIRIISSKKPATVAVLTDFDKEGRRQFKLLVKNINSQNIKVDNILRKRIKLVFNIQRIEELNSITRLLDGNTLSNCNKVLNRKKFFRRARSREARFHE